MDEETLIPMIINGDTEAFTLLYNMYTPRAYHTALLICGNVHTAEDIVQEAFIICCKKLKILKAPGAFKSYFYRVLTRTAWKMCKMDKQSLPIEKDFPSVDGKTDKSYTELYDAIASLNTKLRTVVILFYFNDLPLKDIARITGCLEGTVKSRLHTARKRLAHILKKEDYYG